MPAGGDRPNLCVIRGGGDLATGVVWRLWTAGWPVVVSELPAPLTIRRTVSVSTAVSEGQFTVEGMEAILAADAQSAAALAADGAVGVVVSPALPALAADVVVDARLAKRNIDTTLGDAPLVVGLGPGFEAGVNCHAAVETKRGHRLGRVLWSGATAANTGVPGTIGGKSGERVLRAPIDGLATWIVKIGDVVEDGQLLGRVNGAQVVAPFSGTVRGLIAENVKLASGLKIGDVDPRIDPSACYEISDKALAIGGGVVEAVLTWSRRKWSNQ
ncbi:MAG: EF2563 family selenium-dependent molybdenum hydroxylase system protein [Acidimicrobiales bacterium]|nr:EF2563 family selenium-dependent molybdenum hydroxylase system protein [Acidimicrobiales bacterium]